MAPQNEQQNVRKSRTTSSDRTDSTSSPPSAPEIVPPAVRPVPQNPDIAPDEPHEREVGIDSILQPTSLDLSLPEVRPDVTRGSVLRGSANRGGGEQNKPKDHMDELDASFRIFDHSLRILDDDEASLRIPGSLPLNFDAEPHLPFHDSSSLCLGDEPLLSFHDSSPLYLGDEPLLSFHDSSPLYLGDEPPLRFPNASGPSFVLPFATEPYTGSQYVKAVETEKFRPAASTRGSQADRSVVVMLPVSKVDV
jgi:hypothetical protein